MQTYNLTNKCKLSKKELAVLIVLASFTITLVSTSSPLYPFNPWNDTNCFFTLGRGIIHGIIPYKDLYEQKGPLLYFIFSFAATISEKSFIGVWIIECIAASIFAVYSWKIVILFATPSKIAITIMPLFLGITYTIKMFNYGGNSEELCFPLLTIALFIGLKSIVAGDGLPTKKETLLCGFITGSLFWIKFTFVGFMIGFCLYILIISIMQKSFKKLISMILYFLLGYFLITFPILVYYFVNNSLNFLVESYFFNNLFLYHSNYQKNGLASIPIIRNIYFPFYSIIVSIYNFPVFGIMLFSSLISSCFINKKYRKKAILLIFLTFVLCVGTAFTKAVFYYYGYILAYSFCLTLIPIVKLFNKLDILINKKLLKAMVVGFLLIMYGMSILLCKNMYLFLQPKDFLSQFRIATTIQQTPDAKLLTYDVMDSGFYTASGLMPCNRYFCHLNIVDSYPAIREEQDRLINEGYFDYIVTTYYFEDSWDNYELVQVETHTYIDFTGEKVLEGFKLYRKPNQIT